MYLDGTVVKHGRSEDTMVTVVSAHLIGQFGQIFWEKTFDSAHFFLVRATEKIKIVLNRKIPQKNYKSAKC